MRGRLAMADFIDVSHHMTEKIPFDYHSHHEYEIYFFHDGACRYLIHNHIYDLEPGDIIIMNGLTLHRPNFFPHHDYVRSVLHFVPAMIQDLLTALNSDYLLDPFKKSTHLFIRSGDSAEGNYLNQLIEQMVYTKNTNDHTDPNTIVKLKLLLVESLITIHQLIHMNHLEQPTKKNNKSIHAENIATYIQENFQQVLTRDQIANELHISKSYASEVFKEMTGFTIMEYIMEVRLKEAKYILEMEPDIPIKDVASQCGFESAAHFSRYFRSKIGITPSAYRKNRLMLFS